MTPTDQQLVAMLAIGAIAAGEDEFVNAFGNQLLGSLMMPPSAARCATSWPATAATTSSVAWSSAYGATLAAGRRTWPPHLAAALEELARANLPVRTTALRS